MEPISSTSPTNRTPTSEFEPSFRVVVDAHDEVASTMTLARDAALAGAPAGHVVTARRQHSGRGRSGASWISEADRGLYATVVLRVPPKIAPAGLSPAMALAVCRGIHALGVAEAHIKWPNDILARGRKLAGLLLEQGQSPSAEPFVLCGIGLNLKAPSRMPVPSAGPAPLAPIGLCEAGAAPETTASEALEALLPAIEHVYVRFCLHGFEPLAGAFDALHGWRHRRVEAVGAGPSGQSLAGTVGDIRPDGTLPLVTPDGVVPLISCTLRLAESSGESTNSGILLG